jgi:hypothetical protein
MFFSTPCSETLSVYNNLSLHFKFSQVSITIFPSYDDNIMALIRKKSKIFICVSVNNKKLVSNGLQDKYIFVSPGYMTLIFLKFSYEYIRKVPYVFYMSVLLSVCFLFHFLLSV